METLLLASLSAAFVINAIDELLFPIGKWRGLVSLAVSTACVFLTGDCPLTKSIFMSMAGGFTSLVITAIIGLSVPKDMVRVQRGLPRRVPPL